MTGAGVALPNEDAAEVERRFANFDAEMAPKTELGRTLTLRTAMLAVRLERCYRNEAARLTVAVDAAPKAYDDGRLTAVEAMMDGLRDDPVTNARRLQQTPEGVNLTIEVWKHLKLDLMHPDRKLWTSGHWERAENLMGRRTDDLPRSRIGALSRAMWSDFSALDPGEAAELDEQGKYEYARDRLAAIIDGRIELLSGVVAGDYFDGAAAERARAGAADRALFDESREAILARKYEAATERSLFRTLREFREVEAAAAEVVEVAAPAAEAGPTPGATVVSPATSEALGSFSPGPSAAPAGDEPKPPSRAPKARSGRPTRDRGVEEGPRRARSAAG